MKITEIGKINSSYVDQVHSVNKNNKINNVAEQKRKDSFEVSNSTRKLLNEIKKSEEKGFSDKVERIRKEILDGNYAVSSDEIADKMLEVIKFQGGK